jgi:signal peptidase II
MLARYKEWLHRFWETVLTMRMVWVGIVVFFVLDRFIKWMIVSKTGLPDSVAWEPIPGILRLLPGLNYGMNFGLFSSQMNYSRYLLIFMAVCISIALIVYAAKRPHKLIALGTSLVVGGALGNVCDRVLYGGVIDYINLTCCGVRNPYIFNIADVFIFLGCAALIWADVVIRSAAREE